MIKRPLSTAFIASSTLSPDWTEAVWGVERGWADHSLLIELAIRRLMTAEHCPKEEVELAGLSDVEPEEALRLAKLLATKETGAPQSGARNPDALWLYLSLRALYENRDAYSDALREVEEIYAEFDYPPSVEPFVRYMPATGDYGPGQHTLEENVARIYSHWENFLRDFERERQQVR